MGNLRLFLLTIILVLSPMTVYGDRSQVQHSHNERFHAHPLPKEGVHHLHNNHSRPKGPKVKGLLRVIKNIRDTKKYNKYGYYSKDEVQVLWLNDGMKSKLLETLTFTDPNGKKWVAPKGHVVDGASIPRLLQPFVGSPYGGRYVMASIIHDVACDEKKSTWKEVHQVFHYAMLASGVSPDKASVMYTGVFKGGPRWGPDAEKILSESAIKKYLDESITFLKMDGELKNYSGSKKYDGFRNGEHISGYVIRKNDTTIKVESGGGRTLSGGISHKFSGIEIDITSEPGHVISGVTVSGGNMTSKGCASREAFLEGTC